MIGEGVTGKGTFVPRPEWQGESVVLAEATMSERPQRRTELYPSHQKSPHSPPGVVGTGGWGAGNDVQRRQGPE